MGLLFPKPQPNVLTKHAKRTEAKDALEDAYDEVDLRDGGICQVTGRYTRSDSVDNRVRREHHHLVSRSLAPERITDPTNIVTVCAEAHALFKAGWLISEGTDATKPVRFHWAAHVAAKDKLFVIKSRRWSGEQDEP